MKTINILDIRIPADRTRHPLPGDLMHQLACGEIGIVDAVRQWRQHANRSGHDVHLNKIRDLATSIFVVGLLEPIVITPDLMLVSGLRRLLAHAWLVVDGYSAFSTISVRVIDQRWSPVQQLVETTFRTSFTAVEMAINLGRCIADLENGKHDPPFTREGGAVKLSPTLRELADRRRRYGTWQTVMEILGKTYRHWSNYLSILTLCDPALLLAQRAGMTENSLRGIVHDNLSCREQVQQIRDQIGLTDDRPAEEAEEEEEEEKIGPASPSAIASVRKIVNACDYLATFNEDSLRDAVASAFDRLEPEDLEDAYVSFEVIYRTLRNVRNWHKGADRNE